MSDVMHFIGSYRLLSSIDGSIDDSAFFGKYLAERQDQHTQYVVKVFSCRYEAGTPREAFLEEARCLAEMNHPHILPVLDYGVEDGRCYLVREYTPHGSLRDHLSRGEKLPLETVFCFIEQIAEALQYAHNHNILHQDIRPENILFTEKDKAVLTDFGLAYLQSERRAAPQNGTLEDFTTGEHLRPFGSESNMYRAPEQLQGFVSPRSDIYSLAAVIYEWLGGTLPTIKSLDNMYLSTTPDQKRKEDEQVDSHHRSLSIEVEGVLLKALAKDPTKRYASVGRFVHALRLAIDKKQRPVQQTWKEKHLSSFSDPTLFGPWEDTDDTASLQKHDTLPLLTTCLAKTYIEQAFAALPWIERNCLLLYADAEFTQSDIAAILDLDKQAVQRHLKQASKQWLQTYISLVEKDLSVSPVGSALVAHPEETIARVKKLVQAQSHYCKFGN